MTVRRQVHVLAKLRRQVTHDRMLLIRKGAKDGADSEIERYRRRWRDSLDQYLNGLARADIDPDELHREITRYVRRLDAGMVMDPPDDPAERFRFDRHFEKLLVELEVCYDLRYGHEYTRSWFLRSDGRLQTVRNGVVRRKLLAEHNPNDVEKVASSD